MKYYLGGRTTRSISILLDHYRLTNILQVFLSRRGSNEYVTIFLIHYENKSEKKFSMQELTTYITT